MIAEFIASIHSVNHKNDQNMQKESEYAKIIIIWFICIPTISPFSWSAKKQTYTIKKQYCSDYFDYFDYSDFSKQ
jgi:hypothetical protein